MVDKDRDIDTYNKHDILCIYKRIYILYIIVYNIIDVNSAIKSSFWVDHDALHS